MQWPIGWYEIHSLIIESHWRDSSSVGSARAPSNTSSLGRISCNRNSVVATTVWIYIAFYPSCCWSPGQSGIILNPLLFLRCSSLVILFLLCVTNGGNVFLQRNEQFVLFFFSLSTGWVDVLLVRRTVIAKHSVPTPLRSHNQSTRQQTFHGPVFYKVNPFHHQARSNPTDKPILNISKRQLLLPLL